MNLTHASFFSGAGGMDIGLERAGWRTVSFSEIDPYANAILSHRWPGVPNIGDVTKVTAVPEATLWTGGFPCQDLSRAGKRRGIDGSRSGLAWPFLDLVEAHRPEALILENVPGLLSSNAGRDFGRLLREVGELGYGWAYRVFDSSFFGVPQRRKRVFILALDLGRHRDPYGPAKVLAVGAGCVSNHREERAARRATSGGAPLKPDRGDGAKADAARVGEADGVAGRVDGGPGLEAEIAIWVKRRNAASADDDETWGPGDMNPTLTAVAIPRTLVTGGAVSEDPSLLPAGLDSNRYQAIGNGVVSPVAEWVGRRLADYLRDAGARV